MGDGRRQDLVRRSGQGDRGARARLLAERLRGGELDLFSVEVAAIVGDPGAIDLLGLAGPASGAVERARAYFRDDRCSPRAREAILRIAIAALRVAAPRVGLPSLGVTRVASEKDGVASLHLRHLVDGRPRGWSLEVDRLGGGRSPADLAHLWLRLEEAALSDPAVRGCEPHADLDIDAAECHVACPCPEHLERSRRLAALSRSPACAPFGALLDGVIGDPNAALMAVVMVRTQVEQARLDEALRAEVGAWALGEVDVIRRRVRPWIG